VMTILPQLDCVAFTATVSVGLPCRADCLVNLIHGQVLLVKAMPPAALRIETLDHRFTGNPFTLLISDGHNQLELAEKEGLYVLSQAAPTLGQTLTKKHLDMLIVPWVLFADEDLDMFEYRGRSLLNDEESDVFSLTQRIELEAESLVVAISARTKLPVRISRWFSQSDGASLEAIRTDFSNWSLNSSFEPSVFAPIPPPETRPAPPALALYDTSFGVGSRPAPINAADLSGVPVTLEEYTGKVLLIHFWSLQSFVSRNEIPQITTLYERYRGSGLEVLGVCLDADYWATRVHAFLQDYGMRWRQIYEGKLLSTSLRCAYRLGEVPFYMIIGRDGKVAAIHIPAENLDSAIEFALM
jgi:hypothetical protein